MKLDEGGQSTSYVDQQMMAFFFGHSAEISPKLNMDWGVRYETVDNQGWNSVGIPNNTPESSTFGGIDGNPLTLYDNYGGVAAPQINYRKVSQYISVSAGLNYKIDENQAMYLRLSQGGKSPDVNTLLILNSQFIVDNTASGDLVQKIQQFEMAYKFSNNNFKLFVTPFVSKLSNVALLAYFRNVDNSPYTPPIQFATYFTKGIEIEGDIALNKIFSVKFSALFQDSRAEKYTTWIANANGPADDVLLNFSGNKTGGVPPMMFNIAPSVNLGNFYGIVSYNYLSERPANTPNGWTMKGYNNVDISAGYSFGKHFGIQFNVTNALNQYGVMEWLASGGFPTNLNRDRITPTYVAANPNDSFSALRNMPRAYFMTATYKF
jgi:outer membrane receptor protein involved in Fe transport